MTTMAERDAALEIFLAPLASAGGESRSLSLPRLPRSLGVEYPAVEA